MPRPNILAVTAGLILATTAPARAEHVEITIAVSAVPGQVVTALGGVVATVVFDTDAPPTASNLNSVTFAGVAGKIDGVLYTVPAETNPSSANPAPIVVDGPITSAELVYSQSGDGSMIVRLIMGGATVTLTVIAPAGPFSPAMLSLPDAPAAYLVADPLDYRVSAGLLTGGTGVFASVQRINASVVAIGGVSYNVRLVDPPQEACSAADLAPPFGVLDFSDVFDFLVAFGTGCP